MLHAERFIKGRVLGMKKILMIVLLGMMSLSLSLVQAAYCPRCQFDNIEQAVYCSQCGAPLVHENIPITCQECGFVNPYDANYCGRCGVPVHHPSPHHEPGYMEPRGSDIDFNALIHKEKHKTSRKEPVTNWQSVGQLISTGKSKGTELAGGGKIRRVRFVGLSGSHVIHTLVIREGGKKTPIPITSRLASGQEIVKDLPREFQATGLRISHEGDGNIEVSVQ